MTSSVASIPASNPAGSILRPPQDLVPVFLAASFHGRRLPALEATGSVCPHHPHAGSNAALPWFALDLSHAVVRAQQQPPVPLPAGSAPERSIISIPSLRSRRLRRSTAPPASVSRL